jgi:hypothetical protein
MKLPGQELGLRRGLAKSLHASRYLGKNTNTLTEIYISIIFKLPHLHCVSLVVCLILPFLASLVPDC